MAVEPEAPTEYVPFLLANITIDSVAERLRDLALLLEGTRLPDDKANIQSAIVDLRGLIQTLEPFTPEPSRDLRLEK